MSIQKIEVKMSKATHPFFGIQPRKQSGLTQGHHLVMSHQQSTLNLSIKTFVVPDPTTLMFGDLASAEDAFLDMVVKAHPPGIGNTFDPERVYGDPERVYGRFCNDVYVALAVLITRRVSLIATRTYRGAGRVVICSSKAEEVLLNARASAYAKTTKGAAPSDAPNWGNSNLTFAGHLNSSMDVYVHPKWADDHPVVVIYKGASEIDAPAFLFPFEDEIPMVLTASEPGGLTNWENFVGTVGLQNLNWNSRPTIIIS